MCPEQKESWFSALSSLFRSPNPCLKCTDSKSAADTSTSGVGAKDDKTPKKYKYIDVHVATPYGVTSHLEIPQLDVADSSSQVTDKNTGLKWMPDSAEIPFRYAAGCITPAAPPQTRPPVTIKWDVKKLGPPQTNAAYYDLKISFAKPYGEAKVLYPHPFDEKTAVVIAGIPAGNLVDPLTTDEKPSTADAQTKLLIVPNDLLTVAVVSKFAGYFGPKNVNPPVPVRLNKAILVAKDAKGTVLGQTQLGNELTITWQDMEVCYPALPASPLPCGPLMHSPPCGPLMTHPPHGPIIIPQPYAPLLEPPFHPHPVVPPMPPASAAEKTRSDWTGPMPPMLPAAPSVEKKVVPAESPPAVSIPFPTPPPADRNPNPAPAAVELPTLPLVIPPVQPATKQ